MKEANLSLVRLISMIMIVSCHIFQFYGFEIAFWLNIGVQIFFVLSGYLYGGKEIKSAKEFYKKEYIKIIVPYMLLCIFILIYQGIVNPIYFKDTTKFVIMGRLLGFQEWLRPFPNIFHTWFISYILLCYLIVPVLNTIKKKTNIKQFILGGIILTIILQLFVSYNAINLNPTYILLFIAGYFLRNMEEKSQKRVMVISVILTLVILPVRLQLQYGSFPELKNLLIYFNVGTDIFQSYHHALCGFSIFLILKQLFKKIKYRLYLKISDKFSYYIYLVHQVFILNTLSLLNLTKSTILNIIIALTAILISAIILYYLTKLVLKLFELLKKIKRLIKV